MVAFGRSIGYTPRPPGDSGDEKHGPHQRCIRLGGLPTAAHLASEFESRLATEGFELFAVPAAHGVRAGLLRGPHKDRFDGMLIAQARAENVPIVSDEAVFDACSIRSIWYKYRDISAKRFASKEG
jgi:hypothetical protein